MCINDSTSPPLPVLSGVAQGSVIGPFLFLLFINGISDTLHSPNVNIRLYADDSKLLSTVPIDLQNTIDESAKWLLQRQLLLAPHKCAILKIMKRSVTDNTTFYIGGHPVKEVDSFKDLGITVAKDLKWS